MIFPVSLRPPLSGNECNMIRESQWMDRALTLARYAEQQGEVPVGAVLVQENKIIGEGWNQVIQSHDPTAHAEIQALRQAGQHLKNYRLVDTVLYVTLEPCAMCVGALVHARISRLVFGATDPKTGAVQSALSLLEAKHFNHRVVYQGGEQANACGQLLKNFFSQRR